MREFQPSKTLGVTSLYREVKRRMLVALVANEWRPGEAIPAEKHLCERFGVSIGTLRKAIDDLVTENILIRHQGRGTFVVVHNRDQHLFRFFNVVPHAGEKSYPQTRLVSFATGKADKTACEKLGISKNAKIFQFVNLLSVNDVPASLDEITLPESLFEGMTEAQLRNRPSTLYHLYQVEFGLNVIRIEERLRAAISTPAQSRLLGVKNGTPLLRVSRVAFSYNNRPIEWRVYHVNTERFEYAPNDAQ